MMSYKRSLIDWKVSFSLQLKSSSFCRRFKWSRTVVRLKSSSKIKIVVKIY